MDRSPVIPMMAVMKCQQCGGALSGPMTFCPYCGVRQDIDLRQVHFRDLGSDASMPCPSGCQSHLSVIEFDITPALRIERCGDCHGLFFNPGELQALLDRKTPDLVWLDKVQMEQVSRDFGYQHEVIYKKCPMCAERMSHINFGGKSGVILDRCGTHGVWLDGGELRQLVEWWRAGGKLLYQQHEADKASRLYGKRQPPPRPGPPRTIESPQPDTGGSWTAGGIGGWFDTFDILRILGSLASDWID